MPWQRNSRPPGSRDRCAGLCMDCSVDVAAGAGVLVLCVDGNRRVQCPVCREVAFRHERDQLGTDPWLPDTAPSRYAPSISVRVLTLNRPRWKCRRVTTCVFALRSSRPASTALRPKTVDEHSPAWVRDLPRAGHDGAPARAAMVVRPVRSRRHRRLRVVDVALLILALISYTTRRDTVPSRGMPPGLWSAVWLLLLDVGTAVVPTRVIRRFFAGYTAPTCRIMEAVPHLKVRRPYVVLGTSPASGRVQTLIRFAQRNSRLVPSQCVLRPVHAHDGGRHRQATPADRESGHVHRNS
jgi:hypothetical protein